jgi:hypothetical protein
MFPGSTSNSRGPVNSGDDFSNLQAKKPHEAFGVDLSLQPEANWHFLFLFLRGFGPG